MKIFASYPCISLPFCQMRGNIPVARITSSAPAITEQREDNVSLFAETLHNVIRDLPDREQDPSTSW